MSGKVGGQYGNKNNTKGKALTDALRKALVQYESEKCKMGEAPHAIASNLVKLAVEDSDKWATEFIWDRMDGKPDQNFKHSGSVTVESVSEEHARLVAESFLDSIRAASGDSASEPDRLHDSVSTGLPGGPATP